MYPCTDGSIDALMDVQLDGRMQENAIAIAALLDGCVNGCIEQYISMM